MLCFIILKLRTILLHTKKEKKTEIKDKNVSLTRQIFPMTKNNIKNIITHIEKAGKTYGTNNKNYRSTLFNQ